MRLGRPSIVATGTAGAVALIGGGLTQIGPWYRNLAKPDWNPPDWVFAPVWTLIYALCVYAATVGWRAIPKGTVRTWLLSLFLFNALLNILWSALFFTLRRPDLASAAVVGLWLSVGMLIVLLGRYERRAAMALVPYLAWVSFAGLLNARIVTLNGPF